MVRLWIAQLSQWGKIHAPIWRYYRMNSSCLWRSKNAWARRRSCVHEARHCECKKWTTLSLVLTVARSNCPIGCLHCSQLKTLVIIFFSYFVDVWDISHIHLGAPIMMQIDCDSVLNRCNVAFLCVYPIATLGALFEMEHSSVLLTIRTWSGSIQTSFK